MRTAAIFAATVVLLASVTSSWGSLLPFMDRQDSWLTERFPDPFRVLEHIPFGLDRDDVAVAVSPARVDWKETPTAHHIMIDVPGLKREEVKVEVDENGILTVTGERKKEEEKKGDHWHRVERVYGRFWRQFRLPSDVDTDSVSAKMDHGVLTVTASKLPPEKTKGARVVSIGAEEGTEKEKKKMVL